MVCIYCSGKTQVSNSRHQRQANQTWRRRCCLKCGAAFTTQEQALYSTCIVVTDGASHIVPFQRDKLFLSLYAACRHRPTAVSDATALVDTILRKLLPLQASTGLLTRATIIETTSDTLRHFDAAAHVQYCAFHQAPSTKKSKPTDVA